MEISVVELIAAILGTGAVSSVVTHLLNRRKSANENALGEGSGMQTLLEKLKTLMSEKIDDANKLQEAVSKKAALEVLVRVRDEELIRNGEMIKEILIEQGRAEERERQCQERLSHITERLNKFEDLAKVNKKLVKDNLQLQGTADEKRV